MPMTITIRVEDSGFIIDKKLTIEEVKQSKFDLVCYTIYDLVDKINQARKDHHARHTGANP